MSIIEDLQKQIKKLNERLEAEIEKRKDVECPFEEEDDYFIMSNDGTISNDLWEDYECEYDAWLQGNVFNTEEEAEKERDRRILLTKFNCFRDKCNGDWKPENIQSRYYIYFDSRENKLDSSRHRITNAFHLFGYFKNREDAEVAIELFGDEIKRLFVEE